MTSAWTIMFNTFSNIIAKLSVIQSSGNGSKCECLRQWNHAALSWSTSPDAQKKWSQKLAASKVFVGKKWVQGRKKIHKIEKNRSLVGLYVMLLSSWRISWWKSLHSCCCFKPALPFVASISHLKIVALLLTWVRKRVTATSLFN